MTLHFAGGIAKGERFPTYSAYVIGRQHVCATRGSPESSCAVLEVYISMYIFISVPNVGNLSASNYISTSTNFCFVPTHPGSCIGICIPQNAHHCRCHVDLNYTLNVVA